MLNRRVVALLGVGGVGKTTFVYRILGLSIRPHVTRRPGIYTIYMSRRTYDIIDVPGQLAVEVALNFAKMWTFYADRVIYMYDVTDRDTLYAIAEIHSALLDRGIRPFREVVIVGNKMDLAKVSGVFIEADEIAKAVGAAKVYYISAYFDEPEQLLALLP